MTKQTAGLWCLWGYDLTKVTACTKIHNGTNTVSSHLYFLAFGTVYWTMGLVMLVGQVIGSSIGAILVFAKWAALIRPLISGAWSLKRLSNHY
jgi:uncharacterized protein